MSAQAPEDSAPSDRHLVAVAEAGDGARFAALLAPSVGPVRVRPLADGTFHSSLRSATAGEVRVSVMSGSPCVLTRDPDLIDPADPAFLTVTLHRTGRAGVAQDGRHCLLGPGDLVNYVTSRPYEVTFWEPYEAVVVSVPIAALGSHADTLAGRTAVAVGTDCVQGAAVHLRGEALEQRPDHVPQGAGDDLADRVLAHCLASLAEFGMTANEIRRSGRWERGGPRPPRE